MFNRNTFFKTDYLTKCDFINKYNEISIKAKPYVQSLKLNFNLTSLMTEGATNSSESQIKLFLLFNFITHSTPQIKHKKKSNLQKSKLISEEKSTHIELLIKNKDSLYNFFFFLFIEKSDKISYINEKYYTSSFIYNKNTFKCKIKFNDFFEFNPLLKDVYLNNFFRDSNLELSFKLDANIASMNFLKFIKNMPLFWNLK